MQSHAFPELTLDRDGHWLTSLGVAGSIEQPDYLQALNNDLVGGAPNINPSDTSSDIRDARVRFYSEFPLAMAAIEEIAYKLPALIPTSTFIDAARTLDDLGVDTEAAAQQHIETFTYTSRSIREKVDVLESFGINAADAISAFPDVLSYNNDTLSSKLQTLTEVGVTIIDMFKRQPGILHLSPNVIEDKLSFMRSVGLDPEKVLRFQSSILGQSIEGITAKIQNLHELGVENPARAINRSPGLLCHSNEAMVQKFEDYRSLDLDPVRIMGLSPTMFSLSTDTIVEKLIHLDSIGLNVASVANQHPGIINYASETIDKKLRAIERSARVLNWDYTAVELVNRFPTLLAFDLKKIQMMRRIAATYITPESRSVSVGDVRNSLTIPLETLLLRRPTQPISYIDYKNDAQSHKVPAAQRKASVLAMAQSGLMGRLGAMYLDYRGVEKS